MQGLFGKALDFCEEHLVANRHPPNPWSCRPGLSFTKFSILISQEECDETREKSAGCRAHYVDVVCRSISPNVKAGDRSKKPVSVRRHWRPRRGANRTLHHL